MAGRVPLSSGANQRRVFIDLTDDHEPTDYSSKQLTQGKLPFVTTIAYRSPTVPQKRNSLDVSDDLSDASSDAPRKFPRRRGQLPHLSDDLSDTSSDAPRKFARRRRQLPHAHPEPSTPTPPPNVKVSQEVSVVIPSPTSRQRRDIALAKRKTDINGMDDEIFPTTKEDEIIAKATYPTARDRIDRRSVLLPFSPPSDHYLTPKLKSLLTELKRTIVADVKRDHLTKLSRTLNKKLRRIAGPPVIADVDCPKLLARLADNFEFVNSYQYRAGVEPVPDESEFNIGCACNGKKNGCDPSVCDCLNKEEDSEDRIVPYQISESNPKLIVATKDFLRRKAIIYECNSRCGCRGTRCWNHVVQKGRTVKLEIFDTGARGFGLRSPDFLHRGQFIDLYLGEVITKAEAEERENLTDGAHTESYLFSLDWNIKDDEDEDRNMKVVDGRKFGSATRFMNHSCNPNCKIVPVSTTNHADEYLYNLAFFANQDIAPGTELTFDYNQGEENTTPARVDPDAVPCLCGEDNCRGQLWPNKRKSQGSKP
ncbi:uncharacterized protein N7515_004954 [Penicillium bovifimosum]|uniref:Uncharacterized protein n=1 Tax=Penicillium bovifimosum TaxID=126998 RepID=A0A9W9L3Z5_9EURO|nr:uncharacterized protein N7515_004954 [Penicillium bovifimosum]KAJ5135676.1 hypothetical protein N7515_004954 [Penicillium bovifimosum]